MSESSAITRIDPATGAVIRTPGSAWGMAALAQMSQEEFEHRRNLLRVGMERVKQLHETLMDDGKDYGTVQGIDKPFLQQPGAEKLCLFYHLVPTHIVDVTPGDGITSPPLSVVVRCRLHVESEDGPVVGEGLGAANSWEKKHRWRFAELRCPHCDTANIRKSRNEEGGWFCWKKLGGCGATFADGDPTIERQERGMIENPDPWDLQNTLVKMARKRAFVDAAKGTTGTSSLYSQDPDEVEAQQAGAQAPAGTGGQQQRPANGGRPANGKAANAKAAPTGDRCECGAPPGKHTTACPKFQRAAPTRPPVSNTPAPPANGDRKALNGRMFAAYEKALIDRGEESTDELMRRHCAQVLRNVKGDSTIAASSRAALSDEDLRLCGDYFEQNGIPLLDWDLDPNQVAEPPYDDPFQDE